MTNEDAIEILKEQCYIFDPLNFDITIMVNTALDKAIIALMKCTEAERRKER